MLRKNHGHSAWQEKLCIRLRDTHPQTDRKLWLKSRVHVIHKNWRGKTFNPFMPVADKKRLIILVISLYPKRWLQNIWRRVVRLNFIYNSPLKNLKIYASFQSYFKKYTMSRQFSSRRSSGMNGVTCKCCQYQSKLCKKNNVKYIAQI